MTQISSQWPVALRRIMRFNDLRKAHELIPESVAPRAFDEHGRDAIPLAQRLQKFLEHIGRRADKILDELEAAKERADERYLIWHVAASAWTAQERPPENGHVVMTTDIRRARIYSRAEAFEIVATRFSISGPAPLSLLPVPISAIPKHHRPCGESAQPAKEEMSHA